MWRESLSPESYFCTGRLLQRDVTRQLILALSLGDVLTWIISVASVHQFVVEWNYYSRHSNHVPIIEALRIGYYSMTPFPPIERRLLKTEAVGREQKREY